VIVHTGIQLIVSKAGEKKISVVEKWKFQISFINSSLKLDVCIKIQIYYHIDKKLQ